MIMINITLVISYLNVKQRIKQMNQNLTEDRYEEKAIPSRKINMCFNNLVGTKRLKYMLTFLG